MTIPEPAWLLLAWAGLAATLAASFAGAAPGTATLFPPPVAGHDAAPGPRTVRSIVIALVAGVIVYPLLYGGLFEGLNRADIGLGAGLGAAHGVLALLVRAIRNPARARPPIFNLLLGRLLYGAVLGFLYVVPVPPAA